MPRSTGWSGVRARVAVGLDQLLVDHRPQVVVGQRLDLGHLVGGAEAVEEVQERHAALQRGRLGDQREVLGLLHRVRAQHAQSRSAGRPSRRSDRRRSTGRASASVRAVTCMQNGVSSPAILYMLGIISSRPCDAVNVVVSAPACSAPCTAPAAPAFGLHLRHLRDRAPDVSPALGRPLVRELAHRRRRRDRVDRDDLAQAMGHGSGCFVGVERNGWSGTHEKEPPESPAGPAFTSHRPACYGAKQSMSGGAGIPPASRFPGGAGVSPASHVLWRGRLARLHNCYGLIGPYPCRCRDKGSIFYPKAVAFSNV